MKTINISGVIGWDATAPALREALQSAGGEDVRVVISSPGGFVSEGLEMFNLLRNYAGDTTAVLSGYAMSMASYIPLACNHIVAEDNAIYMIHNVRGGVFGDHNDIISYGNTTKGMSRLIAKAYAKRTGKDMAEVEKMMDVETYLFGDEMVEHGFVDEIITTESDKDPETARAMACVALQECSSRMSADISAVKKDLANAALLIGAMTAATDKPHTTHKQEEPMNKEKLKADHPDVFQAILDEGKALAAQDQAAALEAARTEGATAELQRITACQALVIPGHEALVNAMALDGKSTSAEVALAIVAAEKTARATALAALNGGANPPVAPAAASATGDAPAPVTTDDDGEVTEEAAQAKFLASAELRKEFGGSFKAYFAFVKASQTGKARILGK